MPVTDNRTQLSDGENNNNVSGDSTAQPSSATSSAGAVIEGTNAIAFQTDDAQEVLLLDQDTGEATFNLDLSDSTVYMMIKYANGETYANLGGLVCFGDAADGGGGDIIGYICTGADVPGLPYDFRYGSMKLDVSVVVATPGTDNVDYYTYQGTEAGLNHAAVLQVGYGTIGLVKAVSTAPNAWFDGFYYIANDSYAASIVGGTSGTPETMADIAGDDVTDGMGMFNNPKGSEYGIFAPTEWGDSGTADSYFTSDNEQWYFIGDNAGGHAVGVTHFPMRLVGNSTGTNSWVISNTVMVNTGTVSQFDMSNADMDTATMSGCTMIGFDTIELPTATTRAATTCTFLGCAQVTGNETDVGGSSFIGSTVAADGAALSWNETISAAHTVSELDDTTFEMGANNHHAISFPTTVSDGANLTLRNIEFTGFDADGTGDSDNSMIELLATTGTITLTLEGCTVDDVAASESNFTVDTRAGCTAVIVTGAVTVQVTATTDAGAAIQSARVHLRASAGPLPYGDAVTITRSATTATVAHTGHGLESNDKVYLRGITDKTADNGVQQVTVTGDNAYTFTTADSGATTYTGDGFIIDAQDETSYDNAPTTEGTFDGGTGHSVSDVITLRGGAKITVDAVSTGVVTQFTVDSGDSVGGRSASNVQDQVSTTGSGSGFSLTLDTDNIATQIRSTYVALDGDTDANGEISVSRVFGSNQPVVGWARRSTSAPYYKEGSISGQSIDSSTGLNFISVMVSDE